MVQSRVLNQMIGCGPVAMTIQERPNDSAAQHSWKCSLIGLRLPGTDYFLTPGETANAQALLVCRAAAEARQVRRVGFLKVFFAHRNQGNGRMRMDCSSTTLKWLTQSSRDSRIWVMRAAKKSGDRL